ncbi:hypothetical protein [Arthrobacter sp. ISL-30]|uniref:hypothetical protein n=1 Tax=Arthrobacter sp. ISL-30 TaxID=2819109 RepID=UPI001BE8F2DA|nr:hypothetical protein [Arthrobacter sp. ISL-30]MBT2514931.1 hypothetical protein [Arthrobacter sp. ISL-30]
MDQDRKDPNEEVGGYGTPTAEQEAGEGKQFAQPREEEAFDEAGLNQGAPDGETYPSGAPDLSHLGTEERDSAGEPGAGRFGGIDDQSKAESESDAPGFQNLPTDPGSLGESGEQPVPREATLPSSEAEMDEGNTEGTEPGRPYSSEPEEDAAGLPEGDGTGLPDERSPRDDQEAGERFDAG